MSATAVDGDSLRVDGWEIRLIGIDGLHLTEVGYQRVAETFFNLIVALIGLSSLKRSQNPSASWSTAVGSDKVVCLQDGPAEWAGVRARGMGPRPSGSLG